MKIALVCPYELRRPGGVRSHIAGLGEALVSRGHVVEVIAPTDETQLASLPVIGCGGARKSGFSGTQIDLSWAAWSDVKRVAARGYDVMHFHTIWNPLMPLQLATVYRGPKVATFHDVPGPDTPPWASRLMRPAAELIRRFALDEVIAVSPSVARYLSPHRYTIIPNGVTIPSPLPPEGERRSLLFVGRLEPRKGIRTLIDAMQVLGADAPPLIVAGDGPLRQQLERNAAGITPHRITFVGAVSDAEKWRLLRDSMALVAPSAGGESFGIVLLEALVAGTPPIAAANPGYADLLAQRAGELLFPVNDTHALVARIRSMQANAATRAALGAWGSTFAQRFAWPSVVAGVEDVYRRAVTGRV